MAASDVLLKDQSTTPASFAPESSDQGVNAAGIMIKRSMVGSADGAQATIGAKADAAATAPKTPAPWSVVSVLKAIWGALPAVGTAGAPSNDVLTVQGPAGTLPVSLASAPLPTGAATASGVAAVATALGGPLQVANVSSVAYTTVAASAAAQVLGATGAAGDFLGELLVVPTSTSPGAVSIQDGTGTAITIFAGGANSVSNLVPFGIPLGVKSKAGGWKVTTGAGLSVVATGNFT